MWALPPIIGAHGSGALVARLATRRCRRRLRSKVCVGMLLDADQVADVQTDCFAEDIDPPDPLPSWTKDQWVAFFESGGEEAAAVQVLAPKQRISPARYEVVHTTCFVRASPNVSAKAVGQHPCGAVVEVDEVRDGWALLSDTSEPQRTTSPTGECWMLIDGKAIGLGQLLQPLPPQLVRRRPAAPIVCGKRPALVESSYSQPLARDALAADAGLGLSTHPSLPPFSRQLSLQLSSELEQTSCASSRRSLTRLSHRYSLLTNCRMSRRVGLASHSNQERACLFRDVAMAGCSLLRIMDRS